MDILRWSQEEDVRGDISISQNPRTWTSVEYAQNLSQCPKVSSVSQRLVGGPQQDWLLMWRNGRLSPRRWEDTQLFPVGHPCVLSPLDSCVDAENDFEE